MPFIPIGDVRWKAMSASLLAKALLVLSKERDYQVHYAAREDPPYILASKMSGAVLPTSVVEEALCEDAVPTMTATERQNAAFDLQCSD
jgi:hypothetical protein